MSKYLVSLLVSLILSVGCGADTYNPQWVMDPMQEKVCGELCDYCAQQVALCDPPPNIYSRDLCMEVVVQVRDMSAAECHGSLGKRQEEVTAGSFCGYLKDDNCWVKTVIDPWWK